MDCLGKSGDFSKNEHLSILIITPYFIPEFYEENLFPIFRIAFYYSIL